MSIIHDEIDAVTTGSKVKVKFNQIIEEEVFS